MKKTGKGIRNTPINIIKDAVWYYENSGNIDLVVWHKYLPTGSNDGVVQIKIPARLLRETVRRMEHTKNQKELRRMYPPKKKAQ